MSADTIKAKQLKLKQKSLVGNTIPQTDVGMASGITRNALQGLTFGFSDEIGAGVGAGIDTLFTDKTFNESFDRRVEDSRSKLKSFSKANPKTALAADVVGSIAPVAASFLLTPFTGGASQTGTATTAARLAAKGKKVLDSTPLLAGNVAKPGTNLLRKSYEGAKLGGKQGLLAGYGYSDADNNLDKSLDTAGTGLLGTTLGAALPPALKVGGKVIGGISNAIQNAIPKSTSTFDKAEVNAIRNITDQFLNDDISAEQVVLKIQDNIAADKLEGLSPAEILADFGGEAVARKLRGIKVRLPGSNVDETLIGRTTGTDEVKAASIGSDAPNIQSTRVGKSLEDTSKKTIKTEGINLEGGIDDIESAIQTKLRPLYDTAYAKNTAVNNLDVYTEINKSPVLRNAYQKAKGLYNEKLIARGEDPVNIPSLNKLYKKEKKQIVGVTELLPLEFLDMIKRVADQTTFKAVREGTIDAQMAGPRKKIANNYRDTLKSSVQGDEYVSALDQASDKFGLSDAYNKGIAANKVSANTKTFKSAYDNLKTDAEKDAFRVGVFQSITDQLYRVKDSQNVVNNILGSPLLRNKLDVLFEGNEAAKQQFISRLLRESKMAQTNKLVTGGSNTADKLVDESQAIQSIEELGIVAQQPTSSAGVRAGGSLFSRARELITDPTGSKSNALSNVLMESNPQRQMEIMELMQQLQNQQRFKNTLSNLGTRGATRVGVNQFGDFLGSSN